MPAPLSSCSARSSHWPLLGLGGREGHQPFELHVRQLHRLAREIERGLRALHAVAAEAGVAFDQEADVDAVALAGLRQPARHHLVVEHHRHALEPPDQRGEPLGLGLAQHVVGEQDVVGDAGVGHHLDLAELLAGDADRAGLHLHLGERRDLVRLDVRAVGEAVARERVLRAPDVGLDDVEVDDDRGCIEICDHGRHEFVVSRKRRAIRLPRAYSRCSAAETC